MVSWLKAKMRQKNLWQMTSNWLQKLNYRIFKSMKKMIRKPTLKTQKKRINPPKAINMYCQLRCKGNLLAL
jgi:hypothetical protein